MQLENTEILITNQANQFDTLSNIDKVARLSKDHPFITDSIKKYNLKRDPNSLKKIAKAGFNIAKFFPDPAESQTIRTVNRFLKDRRANCVDYTVFFSAFLRALRVPHVIRMVSFDPNNPGAFSHIYPVTLDGVVFDVVPGQDQTGREALKSPKNRTFIFNREVPYVNKFDKKIRP